MSTMFDQVIEFHQTFAREADPPSLVSHLPPDRVDLRERLILEEMKEVREAVEIGDRAKILHEITDLMYVVVGYYRVLGISEELARAAFDEVHRANMSKLLEDGSVLRREDGKVLKGPLYRPPDLRPLVPARLGDR